MAETKTVLVAEDEALVRALIRATLRNTAYRVLEASNGGEALFVARLERPHLVLLDVGLPEVDGYAVCRTLKSDPATADIKVIMLSARAQRADRERGAEAGADAYVTKPFSPAELLASLQQWLGA